ncbi:Hypothetical protein LLA12_01272 [Lactococcus lactis subsp. lactis]|nr:Hypothetical protein LLA12_01272 [Lactococcus lactis subsp. lactis]
MKSLEPVNKDSSFFHIRFNPPFLVATIFGQKYFIIRSFSD